MSDAIAVPLRLERLRRFASFRTNATTTVLVGKNASGMAAVLNALALLVRVDQYLQSGKSMSAGSVLHTVLAADDLRQALHEAREQQHSIEFARSVLGSAEEATQLPSITTLAVGSTLLRAPDLPPFDDLDRAAADAEQFWLFALALLHARLEPVRCGFRSPALTRQSSPCGVLRLAAPRVPRAPGGPAASPFSSNSCVLAA